MKLRMRFRSSRVQLGYWMLITRGIKASSPIVIAFHSLFGLGTLNEIV